MRNTHLHDVKFEKFYRIFYINKNVLSIMTRHNEQPATFDPVTIIRIISDLTRQFCGIKKEYRIKITDHFSDNFGIIS